MFLMIGALAFAGVTLVAPTADALGGCYMYWTEPLVVYGGGCGTHGCTHVRDGVYDIDYCY